MTRIRRFIEEAVSELKKVSWPTLEQTRSLTVLVFAVSVLVGLYVFTLDKVFQGIIGLLSKALA